MKESLSVVFNYSSNINLSSCLTGSWLGNRLNKATTEELIGYYNQGILTKEEEKKYHIHKLLKEMYKKQLGYGANDGGADY